MEEGNLCPTCGGPRESSGGEDYCPACYLSVGLEGIDVPAEEPMPEIAEKPGDTIGRFELLEEIGEGGFGVVFRAEQHRPVHRTLALKVIKPGMDSREIVARFEAERQALALMDHPHIAKVLDAGATTLGRPFFVMELVEGLPLTSFCDRERLSVRERLKLFIKICNGVQHAHQKGIIHRDLKPSNILVHLDDNGEPCPKIIDFGVAKAIGVELTEQTFFTVFGRLVGTPEYMSPEQAELNAIDVDTRSDIYSLGVILHELLVGCAPLSREQLTREGYDGMRRMIREQIPPRLSARLASFDVEKRERVAADRKTEGKPLARLLRHDLEWIVMRAIEKDRRRRYETALDLGVDVGRYLGGLPVHAGPPSKAYRVSKFVGRHRLGVGVAAVMVFLLFFGIYMLELRRQEALERYANSQKELREKLLLTARYLSETRSEGWLLEAKEAIRQAAQISVGGDLPETKDLRNKEDLRDKEDLRNTALKILAGSDMRKVETGLTVEEASDSVVFSADHKLVAIVRDHERVEILDRESREPVQAPLTSDLPLDGCRLAFGGAEFRYLIIAADPAKDPRLEVIDRESGKACLAPLEIANGAFDLLPEGEGIAVAQGMSVRFLDWHGEDLAEALPCPAPPISLALFANPQEKAPDRKPRLAVGFQSPSGNLRKGSLSIFEYPSCKKLPLDWSGFEPRTLSWSPTGQYLAMADGSKNLTVIEPGVINTDENLPWHFTPVRWIAWSPDGRLLATATASDREIRLWNVNHWELLSSHGALASSFSFSPDGKHLGPVISDRKLFHLEILSADVCHKAIGHRGRGGIKACAWDSQLSSEIEESGSHEKISRNRYSLAFATAGDDSVIVWDRRARDVARFFDVTHPSGLAFSESWFYMAGEEGIVRRGVSSGDLDPFGPFLENKVKPCLVEFGPPQRFSDLTDCREIAVTPDGKWLVAASLSGVWLVHTENETKHFVLDAPPGVHLDIDPTGQWLALGHNHPDHHPEKVQIYELPRTEESPAVEVRLARTLEVEGVTEVTFARIFEEKKEGEDDPPDQRILLALADASEYRFWDVLNDWQELHDFAISTEDRDTFGRISFSPRTTALAVSYQLDRLKVLHPSSMQVLIRPGFDRQWPLAFSDDGAIIATEGHDGRLFLWDLQAVRQEFDELDIDWIGVEKFEQPEDLHLMIDAKVASAAGEE